MHTVRCCCVCLVIFAAASGCAAEKWVFLKDGRICLSALDGDPCSGRAPDGGVIQFAKDSVQGTRTIEQVEQAVDAMLAEMVRGKNMEEHGARFNVFRASAVPGLLRHLANDALNEKLSVLYALCFCWSPAAVEPVMKEFRGNDAHLSRVAYMTLQRNVPALELGKRVRDLADDPDIAKAVLVFPAVEQVAPDPSLKRIRRLMATPEGRRAAASFLPHYSAPDLAPAILELLASGTLEERRCAAAGLISSGADDDRTRVRMAELLRAPDAELRQLGGEFFSRRGAPSDLPNLRSALAAEENSYARASVDAAVRMVAARAEKFSKLPDTLSVRWVEMKDADPAAAKLQLCLTVLNGTPGAQDFSRARRTLHACVAFEPHHWYSGSMPEWHERIVLGHAVERLLDAAPCGALDSDDESNPAAAARAADRFVPPVDAYFDRRRKSFGYSMPSGSGIFADSVHIGDDCAWHREFRTIVAIGRGVVRSAAYVPSWGHIVVIEHTLKDGSRVCSLYGHMASFIYVKPGDAVEAGQKIGTIGRENTIENGGYGAHLHFGIHAGAYNPGGWICGYVSKPNYEVGKHDWLNPQEFLERHRER